MDIKNFKPTISNILFEWKTLPESELHYILSDELQKHKESEFNLFPKVVATGPDCKTVKVGDYLGMNITSFSILTIDEIPYGVIKEHQVDVSFTQKPTTIKNLEGDKIKTTKTNKKVQDFQTRASKNDLKL